MDTKILTLIERYKSTPGALLPLLHAIQDELGYIPPESLGEIAKALNLSRAEVHGVVSYYHHFRSTPPGRHVVQVCRAEACRACGGERLLAAAGKKLGCKVHETSADGMASLEAVYCLGLCAQAPAVQIDERPHARMDEQKLVRLLDDMEGAR